jgi:WD40 repeat protein
MPLVYPHLREVAAAYVRRERNPDVLQATSLVHELYLRLLNQKKLRGKTARITTHATGQFFRTSPNTAVFSHSGKYLALSAVTDAMQVLEWPSGRSLYTLKSPPGGTSAVAFSRDDSRIAVAGTDGILRIYDSSSGKLVARNEDLLGESFAIDFSADGRQVVAGGADKAAIFVDAATGKLIRRIGPLADVVAYLAISPDGKHLSAKLLREESSALSAPVLVWDTASGQKVAEWTPPGVALGAA